MTTATVEILEEAYEDNPESARILKAMLGLGNKFNKAAAARWLENKKKDDLDNDLGKGVRPWEIVNVSAKLDPNQPWFGVEYETGYSTRTSYESVINHVWANHPLTAIDREGCGAYPVEITFAPVNMDTFMSKEYHMDRLLAFQKDNNCLHARHGKDDNVGTHVNVSTPAYRKLDRATTYKITELLNVANRMSAADLTRVYGRVPYGGFNAMSDLRGNQWIEGKLFNSTGSLTTWAKYKVVMSRIGELIEYLSRKAASGKLTAVYKTPAGKALSRNDDWDAFHRHKNVDIIQYTNLAEFLLGEIKIGELKYEYKPLRRNGFQVDNYR